MSRIGAIAELVTLRKEVESLKAHANRQQEAIDMLRGDLNKMAEAHIDLLRRVTEVEEKRGPGRPRKE